MKFQHPVSAPSSWALWEQCDHQYRAKNTTEVSHELFLTAYILRLFVDYHSKTGRPHVVLPTPDDTYSLIHWDDMDGEKKDLKTVLCAVTFSSERTYQNLTVFSFIILEARGEKHE